MGKTVKERIDDIKKHPELHHHTFEGLQRCCMTGRVLDTALVEAHSVYASLGMNGGQRCDVVSGPCACGAWH